MCAHMHALAHAPPSSTCSRAASPVFVPWGGSQACTCCALQACATTRTTSSAPPAGCPPLAAPRSRLHACYTLVALGVTLLCLGLATGAGAGAAGACRLVRPTRPLAVHRVHRLQDPTVWEGGWCGTGAPFAVVGWVLCALFWRINLLLVWEIHRVSFTLAFCCVCTVYAFLSLVSSRFQASRPNSTMGGAELQAAFKQFKGAFDKNDLATCSRLLTGLKLQLAQMSALGMHAEDIKASNQDLLLAREVLEHAVLLGVKLEDEAVFERNFAQLKSYYAATRRGTGRDRGKGGCNVMAKAVITLRGSSGGSHASMQLPQTAPRA